MVFELDFNDCFLVLEQFTAYIHVQSNVIFQSFFAHFEVDCLCINIIVTSYQIIITKLCVLFEVVGCNKG